MSPARVVAVVFALVSSVRSQAQCPGQMDADVLILGAGMAGLGAAETLSQAGIDNFLIIDQRDQVGGRVQTAEFGGGIVELGPQWILNVDLDPTDDRQPLLEYVTRCNIALRDVPFGSLGSGVVSYNSRGENIDEAVGEKIADFLAAQTPDVVQSILDTLPEDEDISLTQGLRVGGWNPRTELDEHAEYISLDFPFAFPGGRVSYRDALTPDIIRPRTMTFADAPVSRIVINYPEGLSALPRCIADGFLAENDTRLILGTTIMEIEWSNDCICATSRAGQRYCAPYAIVTFSAGVLQNNVVKFTPPLPMIKNITLNQFEMGHFLKIYLAFNETFWDDDVDIISYSNEFRHREYYPIFVTWGAQFPQRTNVLEAIVHGLDESKRIAHQDLEITRQEIAEVLRDIYGERASEPTDIIIADFIANPYFFGNIFTVAVGVGPRQFDEMNTPCGNMYFSGDALTQVFRSSLHGALLHGRETASRIAEILQGPLSIDFINDTPLVEGNTITAEFRTSKQADSVECIIPAAGIRIDCSSGRLSVTDLADGRYSLRVVARAAGDDRAVVGRVLTINTANSSCHAHLLSDASVTGGRATIEFSSSGLQVSGFQCSLDSAPTESCASPLVLRELTPGSHRVRIDPVCEGEATRVVAQFEVEE